MSSTTKRIIALLACIIIVWSLGMVVGIIRLLDEHTAPKVKIETK